MNGRMELEAAIRLMSQLPARPGVEELALPEALGRVLAEDCTALLAVPPFDRSPFDGYAVRGEETPGSFRVVAAAAAGCASLPRAEAGEAIRLYTGAPIPPGTNAVVRQEDVEAGNGTLKVPFAVSPGSCVIPRGEDVPLGKRLIEKGSLLTPGHLGLLASQGVASVPVFRRPRVILIPTGSELSEPGETLSPYGIYNSSCYAIEACLTKLGLLCERRAIVPDAPQPILRAVRAALEDGAELVLTTGGASVGDYDFSVSAAAALGAERLIDKVNVKPGGTVIVSRRQEKLLVNLSGNPAAALMSLLVVLLPYLERLCGLSRQTEEAVLPIRTPMPKTAPATRLLRGHLLLEEGRAWFMEHQGRGNGNIASFAGCDLIGLVPGGSAPLRRGDPIRVLRLPPCLL